MGSLRRRGISVVGIALVTWVVGVPSASAGLVEEVVDAGKSVLADPTSSLPNVLPPVTEPPPSTPPAPPQTSPQPPGHHAPENPTVAAPTPPRSSYASAPAGGVPEVASPDTDPPATGPATNAGVAGTRAVSGAPREAGGAERPARDAPGAGAGQRHGVAIEPGEATGPPPGPVRHWPAVALERRSAVPSDTIAPPSFDPISIDGGMGLLLTMVTSVLGLVALVALARLVVGEEFRVSTRWRH
jgi:hypothetical protein